MSLKNMSFLTDDEITVRAPFELTGAMREELFALTRSLHPTVIDANVAGPNIRINFMSLDSQANKRAALEKIKSKLRGFVVH